MSVLLKRMYKAATRALCCTTVVASRIQKDKVILLLALNDRLFHVSSVDKTQMKSTR